MLKIYVVLFRNFWQGWSGGERSAEEIKDSFAYGIKISRKFSFRFHFTILMTMNNRLFIQGNDRAEK
jgi:hypothetical protein